MGKSSPPSFLLTSRVFCYAICTPAYQPTLAFIPALLYSTPFSKVKSSPPSFLLTSRVFCYAICTPAYQPTSAFIPAPSVLYSILKSQIQSTFFFAHVPCLLLRHPHTSIPASSAFITALL